MGSSLKGSVDGIKIQNERGRGNFGRGRGGFSAEKEGGISVEKEGGFSVEKEGGFLKIKRGDSLQRKGGNFL